MSEIKGLCHICGKKAEEVCMICGRATCHEHISGRKVCDSCRKGRK